MPRKNTGPGERSKPKPRRKTVKPIDKQKPKDDPAVSRVSRSRASGRGGRGR